MKTLDEVIIALDACQRGACDKCPYYDADVDICDEPVQSDALYYLKEYKEHLKWHAYEEHCLDNEKKTLQEKKAEFDEVLTDYVALRQWWTEQQENPPLSWEQLKQMKGKPGWVEYESCNRKVWSIIDCFYTDAFQKVKMNVALPHDYWNLEKEMMGVTWQAYRKERK